MRSTRVFCIVRVAGLLLGVVALNATTQGLTPGQDASRASQNANSSKTIPTKSTGVLAKPKTVPRSEYVSDSGCARCHEDKFASYEQTAHHFTSRTANKDTIVGTFAPGSNKMTTADPNLTFAMEEKSGEFFQTAIWGAPGETVGGGTKSSTSREGEARRTRTERLDLVIGSGGKGQTYLYWRDDQLFQLPVGYSTVLRRWVNSPGYKDGTADFERGIIPRCLECHTTYFQAEFPDPEINIYRTNNFELGISCGRCHGPERRHVARYESKNPAVISDDIVNPAKLSAAGQSDVCAQCHGGQGDRELMPAFTYIPGQPLDKYIDLGPIDSARDVDVHGKQGKLLMKSRCYQASSNLNCSTCHDVHNKEPGLEVMSQHCLRCHKVEQSTTHAKIGEAITKNCVDCHMPSLESKVVYLNVEGKKVRPRFRSHWIRIYSQGELE
jgi:Cytochrome c554 and c-prime